MSKAAPATSGRDVALVAAACALIAGAVEAGIAAYRQVVLGQIIFVDYDFVWMTPASFLLLVVPVALVIHVVLAAVRRPLALSTVLGWLTTVLLFSLLVPFSVIAWWAAALLAVGVGLQVGRRAAAARRERWLPALRTVAVALAAILATTGVTVRVARAWIERQASATLTAPTASGPNVLLIVLDTVRSANLGLYGYERPTTPELQGWAAESAVFDRAIVTAPWTLPSHASLLTGRAAGALGVDWLTPLSETPRTLAEALRSRGYATGGFVANLGYTSHESGLARGFVHYDDYRMSWPRLLFHSSLGRLDVKSPLPQARSLSEAWSALSRTHVRESDVPLRWVTQRGGFRPADQIAAALLDRQARVSDRPFFAFLNLSDAHGPYQAPDAFIQRFSRGRRSEIDRYDAAIAWLDHVIDTLLESLRQRGVLDRTIVIVTSDHGEQFGEHGLKQHANSLYLPLLNVPLIIRYPPAVPPVRVGTVVSLQDVATTILELAGIDGDQGIPGSSLAVTWRRPGQAVHGDVISELSRGINSDPESRNARGNMVSRLDERLHYIRDGDGREELYDYRADPQELRNLVSSPAFQADLVRLRAGLPGR